MLFRVKRRVEVTCPRCGYRIREISVCLEIKIRITLRDKDILRLLEGKLDLGKLVRVEKVEGGQVQCPRCGYVLARLNAELSGGQLRFTTS